MITLLLLLFQLAPTTGPLQCKAEAARNAYVSDSISLHGSWFYGDADLPELTPIPLWTSLTGPRGATIKISDTHSWTPKLKVSAPGTYTLRLVVATSRHLGACSVEIVVGSGGRV